MFMTPSGNGQCTYTNTMLRTIRKSRRTAKEAGVGVWFAHRDTRHGTATATARFTDGGSVIPVKSPTGIACSLLFKFYKLVKF